MKTVCNGCKHLNIDESEQNYLKEQVGHIYPHFCKKYKKQVRHFPYSEPYIYPCDECLTARPTEKGGAEG